MLQRAHGALLKVLEEEEDDGAPDSADFLSRVVHLLEEWTYKRVALALALVVSELT